MPPTSPPPRKPTKFPFTTFSFHHIFMASLLTLFSFSFLLFLSFPSSSSSLSQPRSLRIISRSPKHKPPIRSSAGPIPSQILQACKATRFPDVCHSSLSNSPQPQTPIDLIQSAISLSSANLSVAQSMVKSILDSSAGNINRTTAAKNCIEALADSMYRTQSTVAAVEALRIKDARAWMSAALLYQYDCSNAIKYANDTSQTAQTMSFIDSLMTLTSNALSLIVSYDIYGNDTGSWAPPKTERDGFWEKSVGSVRKPGSGVRFPSGLNPDVTVCKEGCDYKAVQSAVDVAPENLPFGKKFVIRIKGGVYNEIVRVPLEKRNLVFLGDGIGKTVITGSQTVGQPGISTYNTATVDGFMASGLTIQNTAGAPTHQAVALRLDSDLSVIENCEFLGNQDTLYAHSLRQYYRSCRIQGNVDFIFGNSAAVFDNCTILVAPRLVKPEKGENNAVTAQGRTDPAQSTGFVFHNCLINGTEEYMRLYRSKPKVHKNFLGRPWKEYSRTVFIGCNMEALVTAQGWMPWSGDFALATLYYGEFENTGVGADSSQRVSWSSQVPKEHVDAYSVDSFIQGAVMANAHCLLGYSSMVLGVLEVASYGSILHLVLYRSFW
ncbi:Probable pectinesterase/pectinesterase inhibitor 51 [Linum perenne]